MCIVVLRCGHDDNEDVTAVWYYDVVVVIEFDHSVVSIARDGGGL